MDVAYRRRAHRLLWRVVEFVMTPARIGAPHPISKPIFVIAPPRSGSTLLFNYLAQFPELSSFRHREAEHLWQYVLPYEDRCEPTDFVGPEDVESLKRRHLRGLFYAHTVRDKRRRGQIRLTSGLAMGLTPIQYLDKTISNCFHLDLLAEMFPDVTFLYLFRDPRPNIASMIEGWPHLRRFGKPQLSGYVEATPDATVSHWTYPAPPGWRGVLNKPLPEICAWSWQQHVEAMLTFRAHTSRPVHEVRYEDLVNSPREVVEWISELLGFSVGPEIRSYLIRSPLSRTTVSAPDPSKWKSRFGSEVQAVLPMVSETATRLGYKLQDK